MLKFTKRKLILPCCLLSWAEDNEGRIAILAKAARIVPNTLIDMVKKDKLIQDVYATRIQEATMGALVAKEMPNGITYENLRKEIYNFAEQEFCQCKNFRR